MEAIFVKSLFQEMLQLIFMPFGALTVCSCNMAKKPVGKMPVPFIQIHAFALRSGVQ